MQQVDILIIGQGLAGSLLAWTLLKSGQRLHIVDDVHPNAASRVAAGLINPVTGQRLVKTWYLEQCYPFALDFYRDMEREFSRPFFFQRDLIQLFQSQQQQQQWLKRQQSPGYDSWCGQKMGPEDKELSHLQQDFGAYRQTRSGFVDISALLQCYRQYFNDKGCLTTGQFDYSQLQLPGRDTIQSSASVQWNGLRAQRVVFCEGYRVVRNPWFCGVGMRPVKGEILTLESTALLSREIINRGKWLLPLSEQRYRCGATYNHNCDLTPEGVPADPGAQTELTDALQSMFVTIPDYQVTALQVGVRPASVDRRPLLGPHPEFPYLHLFNGFGSKGSLMLPYFARVMSDFLIGKTPLPALVNVGRFYT
ncbi:MAG: FAD-binding oxidoreductase [Gammaproteobacteria bacterium]|nr:FAD-binding oxidoreductase [Gammaproteobacteria bacterium]MDH5800952.1 FAD-binding oxidoreductase [Gammaproteobacteria bacterium]